MTGYGRAEAQTEAWEVAVEINTVNHRYIDISVRLPRRYIALEHRIRKLVKERFSRGRFEINFSITAVDGRGRHLVADEGLVSEAVRLLRKLESDHGLSGEIDIKTLLHFREILRVEEDEEDLEDLWEVLLPVLKDTLDALSAMRTEEGQALQADISARIAAMRKMAGEIAGRLPQVQQEHNTALQERIQNLLNDVPVDPQRLAQEVAYLADRSDVTEEVTRIESHLRQLEGLLGAGEPVGRKIDFVIQEMNREINTVSSKVSDLDVARLVIELKHEQEKIREQAQNIE
jgi:uncharacterized protein (TIGR00255 family)